MSLSQDDRLLKITTPLGEGAVLLQAFSGREELSKSFEYELSLVSEAPIDGAALLHQPVSWTVHDPDETPRVFHGVVRAFEAGAAIGRGLSTSTITVVPWFWFLTRTTDCRIYQNLSVPDIVADVFGRFGLSDFRNDCTNAAAVRDYTVQYRETAFDFVSRLLEDEGIAYRYETTAESHTLVLFDAVAQYVECTPHGSVEYRPELAAAPVVSMWNRRVEFIPGKSSTTDYNEQTPATDLLQTQTSVISLTGNSSFEQFEFPGRYRATDEGTAKATLRMEQWEASHDRVRGQSGCSSFVCGGTFTLTKHPADDGGQFVFLAVEHTASEPSSGQGRYRNSFVAAPADLPFRPMPDTPRPLAVGPQSAVVVGPSGEEIYTDEFGRVKVQFFWDRVGEANENSSCWVRLSEAWAGKGWGSLHLPRIGQEVVVEFLHGDPDRPIVTGRVYNGVQLPPFKLPDNKTQSGLRTRSTSGGDEETFNELRFEDKKDEEEIYFHAQKNFTRIVEHDDTLAVANDRTVTVKNNNSRTVSEGNDTTTIEKGNSTLTVSEGNHAVTVTKGKATFDVNEGDHAVTVAKGKATFDVNEGDHTVTVAKGKSELTVSEGKHAVTVSKGDSVLSVGQGDYTVSIGAGSCTIEAAQKITLKVGSTELVLSSEGITLKGLTLKLEAQTAATLKGLKTEVTADAMLVLKGGLTKIN
jgi:type VI secretion system secreted protein VgrG